MFEAPDIRPLSASDVSAANRRCDELLAHSPWLRLWQDFGVTIAAADPTTLLLLPATGLSATNFRAIAHLSSTSGEKGILNLAISI